MSVEEKPNKNLFKGPPDLESLKRHAYRPKKALITGAMVYANGPVHVGHLAGALIPPDVHARYMRMLIGQENVLFVTGSDDHGSTSELAAMKANKSVREIVDEVNAQHKKTMQRYHLSLDIYSGTSKPDCFPLHAQVSQDFIRKMHQNGLLEKRSSLQWYDTKLKRFLQDRFVSGKCPNPKCENLKAYSDECDVCGSQYQPQELQNPISALSQTTPELKETLHWWLNMWELSDTLKDWIKTKEKVWRTPVYTDVMNIVMPALTFANTHEATYKEIKTTLPTHKSKYAQGKKVLLQFENKKDLESARTQLKEKGIDSELMDGWAHRSLSRDVAWGIPMPVDVDADMKDKTFFVWPDSLVAPITFTKLALQKKGRSMEEFKDYWMDPEARVYQFLGQDNVYFYVLMQGSMWLAAQKNPHALPQKGELQLTDVYGAFHLMINGEKMSKSKGNFFTGDQMLDEKGYTADQLRYFLSYLSLPEKTSNMDFATLDDRNKFLAGPMNASFEKPIAACHSKFEGRVPEGVLNEKVLAETTKVVQRYLRSMERADYPVLLNAIENYARTINSLFTQYKPHDDRHPIDERKNALFSCFYVLKNIMIMLYPFVPHTMDKLRQSLNLPENVFCVDEIGVPIPAGHVIGEKQEYFPAA